MHLFWLTFKTPRGARVYIADSSHLMMPRIKASMASQRGEFESGIKLDAKTACKIPAKLINRALTRVEDERLLKRLG
jgi:hypothetical protein